MIFHNYIYRLKCIVRDKQTMFWALLFPILLATLFNMAFSNLSSAETFSEIKIAVVKNVEYKESEAFVQAIKSVSSSEDVDLFDVKYTTEKKAKKLLEDSKVEGYVYFDDKINLVVKESGINQTIIKSFIDDFKQTTSTMETIISKNPESIQNGLLDSIANRNDYLKEVAISSSEPNTVVNYFYTLIAMACLYGSFLGVKEVTALQADLSPQGARVNMAPTHKLKVFTASMFAATTVQFAIILVLLMYLNFILKIDFGNQLGYIILTSLVGTITGVTFGTLVASVVKKGEGLKIAILVVFTNVMCFLAGMMYDKMKYIVNTKAPILGYLNPVNLIADSFYSLYYYNTHTQFFTNVTLLCSLSVVFTIITYLAVRREKYASL